MAAVEVRGFDSPGGLGPHGPVAMTERPTNSDGRSTDEPRERPRGDEQLPGGVGAEDCGDFATWQAVKMGDYP